MNVSYLASAPLKQNKTKSIILMRSRSLHYVKERDLYIMNAEFHEKVSVEYNIWSWLSFTFIIYRKMINTVRKKNNNHIKHSRFDLNHKQLLMKFSSLIIFDKNYYMYGLENLASACKKHETYSREIKE